MIILCSAKGCPAGVDVFAGNTQDASTVPEKIARLQRQYGLKEMGATALWRVLTSFESPILAGREGEMPLYRYCWGLSSKWTESRGKDYLRLADNRRIACRS